MSAESLLFGQIMSGNYSYKTLSAIYGCVEKISNAIASMPLRVVQESVDGHMEVIGHHPVQNIFRSRNFQTMTMFHTIKHLMQDVLMRGNGYLYIVRSNETGLVTSLRWVSGADVSPIYDEQKDTLYYLIPKITTKKIFPKDVIHIIKNSNNGVNGISVLNYAKDVISLTKAAEESAKEFFASGMNINGILSCQTMLNEKQRQDIRASWQLGQGKTSLQILPANVSYQQIGTDADKAQLLESREHQISEIARYFDMPLQLIGAGDKLTYNNLETLNLLFLEHTLQPYMISIEQEMSRKLFPEEYTLSVDFDENSFILRTDKQSTQTYLSGLVASGLMTPNEARRELGLPEIQGGDKLSIAYSDISQNQIN